LEKIRPIDKKLKYQIDKLMKTAALGTAPTDAVPTGDKASTCCAVLCWVGCKCE
jgi:hypothetical protein